MYNLRIRSYNWQIIDKERWNVETDRDKMDKIIKYKMSVQYHKKRLLFKKNFLK